MSVALPAYRLPHAEAPADCWNPSGCDLWPVPVVDCGLCLNVYEGLTEVAGVKRLEGEEQVAEAPKRRAVAAHQRSQEAGDLIVDGARGGESSTASRLAP
jgi:hypothetical protein